MSDAAAESWLAGWMQARGVTLWGAADLAGLRAPADSRGRPLPRAVSWAHPVDPVVMAGIRHGPNQAYADEYARINEAIDTLAQELAADIAGRGHQARPLAASVRTDPRRIRGEFPHKTAATRAGLGWVGRHCQLVTRPFGSWVRLGTVFTDMPLSCGPPADRSLCGRCRRCVDACPAGALTGRSWQPGVPRRALLDAAACDRWKKTHYRRFHGGRNCGICAAVCPRGRRPAAPRPQPAGTGAGTGRTRPTI